MKFFKIFSLSFLIILILATSSICFASYASPYQEPTYLIRYGSRGDGVKWAQSILKENGYSIVVDGIFGAKTKNAVQHFQKYNNLSTDGIVGIQTRTALKKSVSNSKLPTFNRNSSNLIKIIQNCKSYYATNNFFYSLENGVRSIPADSSKTYNSKRFVDCSSFVSWSLYEYARANGLDSMKNYFSVQRNSATFESIGKMGGNNYLRKISSLSEAKAGDILVTPGHVEFLSSYKINYDGSYTIKVYNCGSNASIKVSGVTTSATIHPSQITCILRVR